MCSLPCRSDKKRKKAKGKKDNKRRKRKARSESSDAASGLAAYALVLLVDFGYVGGLFWIGSVRQKAYDYEHVIV